MPPGVMEMPQLSTFDMTHKSVTSEIPPILKLEQWPRLSSLTGQVCGMTVTGQRSFLVIPKYMDSFAEWICFGHLCVYRYSHHKQVMFAVNGNIWEVEVYTPASEFASDRTVTSPACKNPKNNRHAATHSLMLLWFLASSSSYHSLRRRSGELDQVH